MKPPVVDAREPLLKKIEDILFRVRNLREQITEDVDSLTVIQEAAIVRTCLDELEKLVFERYSRECLMSTAEEDGDEVKRLLIVLNRLFK